MERNITPGTSDISSASSPNKATVEYHHEENHVINDHDKEIEDIINTYDPHEIASNEQLYTYEIDKSLRNPDDRNTSICLPEGRLLRSKQYTQQSNHIRCIYHIQIDHKVTPQPKRIIYHYASQDPVEGGEWRQAYKSELQSHIQNESWDMKPIISDDPDILKKTVKLQVICNLKRPEGNNPPKKKVRFVLCGNKQDESTYGLTYSPTLPYDILRILFAEAVTSRRHIVILDISTAYLNAKIDFDIYVELPSHMEKDNHRKRLGQKVVHKVQKAIYGLKQAGRQWYLTLVSFLTKIGFKERGDIPCVLIKSDESGNAAIIIGFFVDDMIITGTSETALAELVRTMKNQFKLKVTEKDNNGYKNILGINFKERRDKKTQKLLSIDLDMSQYIKKLVEKLGMTKTFKSFRNISTPLTPNFQFDMEQEKQMHMNEEEMANEINYFRETIGAIQYIANTLRPDVTYAANYLSKFCLHPHPKIKSEIIRTIKYIYQTREYKIRYTNYDKDISKNVITGYSDADYASDPNTRKSTLAGIFMMNGGPVAWFSRVSKFMANSSTDAEVAAMVETGNLYTHYREVMTYLNLLDLRYSTQDEVKSLSKETGCKEILEPLLLYVDNSSALYLSQKGTTNGKTKHMGVRVARAHDIATNENIRFKHIGTTEMLADILTKPVSAQVMNKIIGDVMCVDEAKVRNA